MERARAHHTNTYTHACASLGFILSSDRLYESELGAGIYCFVLLFVRSQPTLRSLLFHCFALVFQLFCFFCAALSIGMRGRYIEMLRLFKLGRRGKCALYLSFNVTCLVKKVVASMAVLIYVAYRFFLLTQIL